MKITREINGQQMEIELTKRELVAAYSTVQRDYDADWMDYLLRDAGYDVAMISKSDIDDLIQEYRDCLSQGDLLGEAEHAAFDEAIQNFNFPTLEEEYV